MAYNLLIEEITEITTGEIIWGLLKSCLIQEER